MLRLTASNISPASSAMIAGFMRGQPNKSPNISTVMETPNTITRIHNKPAIATPNSNRANAAIPSTGSAITHMEMTIKTGAINPEINFFLPKSIASPNVTLSCRPNSTTAIRLIAPPKNDHTANTRTMCQIKSAASFQPLTSAVGSSLLWTSPINPIRSPSMIFPTHVKK